MEQGRGGDFLSNNFDPSCTLQWSSPECYIFHRVSWDVKAVATTANLSEGGGTQKYWHCCVEPVFGSADQVHPAWPCRRRGLRRRRRRLLGRSRRPTHRLLDAVARVPFFFMVSSLRGAIERTRVGRRGCFGVVRTLVDGFVYWNKMIQQAGVDDGVYAVIGRLIVAPFGTVCIERAQFFLGDLAG